MLKFKKGDMITSPCGNYAGIVTRHGGKFERKERRCEKLYIYITFDRKDASNIGDTQGVFASLKDQWVINRGT